MNFQQIVLTIAIILFIIMLVFIGSVLYNEQYGKEYPPVISDCPDYWVDKSITVDTDKDGDSSSDDPSDENTAVGKCYNVKNLGNVSCDKVMDFTTDFWQGSTGDCRKYKWAKGCDLTWDGITNNTTICDDNGDEA